MNPSSSPAVGVTLGELLRVLASLEAELEGDASTRVMDVRHDSRQVRAGDAFVVRSGGRVSGSQFVEAAAQHGAVALIAERGVELGTVTLPVVRVSDARLALAYAAETVHGNPTHALKVVGITGTNGKTTTAFLTAAAVAAAGGRPGRMGTLGFAFEAEALGSSLTTPEADDISRFAATVRDRGGSHLVMEASSHALALGRVEALHFSVAAFSNLTQDHLDFHESMDAYAAAKRRLFTELRPRHSVINVDDAFGRELATVSHRDLVSVGSSTDADVHPVVVTRDAQGLRGSFSVCGKRIEIHTRLIGDHNLQNVGLVLGILHALGLDVQRGAEGLADAQTAPGRLERCDEPGDDVCVLVDYAHTPDALRRALDAVRPMTQGALWCVFGCGGDRDPKKRPLMGEAVGLAADHAIVTNDNPRSEAPEHIAAAVVEGLQGHRASYEVTLDRRIAIADAVRRAQPGDVVLIAGKGHETTQTIGAQVLPFDDRVEARAALGRRRGGEG
ncbi:MAG: UDP-N-acetylmuramoyl-L-alanyl-D-glutamate--2,6-diaminopimelate ligase [Polyangiaceae bacterium]